MYLSSGNNHYIMLLRGNPRNALITDPMTIKFATIVEQFKIKIFQSV